MPRKNAFTLFEIIIAIILISIIYTFAINSFPKTSSDKPFLKTIFTLKEDLLKYEYDEEITIKCIEDDLSCFIVSDGKIISKRTKPFLENIPTVYKYNSSLDKIEFLDIELEQMESYGVVFGFSCRKNNKCDEIVVEIEEDVYIFNNIKKYPQKVKYLSDVEDHFEKMIQEVKDAF